MDEDAAPLQYPEITSTSSPRTPSPRPGNPRAPRGPLQLQVVSSTRKGIEIEDYDRRTLEILERLVGSDE